MLAERIISIVALSWLALLSHSATMMFLDLLSVAAAAFAAAGRREEGAAAGSIVTASSRSWGRAEGSSVAVAGGGQRHHPVAAAAATPGDDDAISNDGSGSSSSSRRRHRRHHCVDGTVDCVEVSLRNLPRIGTVTILEATAEAQESLVELALREDADVEEEGSSEGGSVAGGLDLPSGDPYGAVLWPAAYAVASHLLAMGGGGGEGSSNNESWLRGRTVLELGAGTGLVSLSCALGGAASVLATDYEKVPLRLLKYAALNLNPGLPLKKATTAATAATTDTIGGCDDCDCEGVLLKTQIFDVCSDDPLPLPSADVVVAADVMYEPRTGRALARRVVEALRNGSRVVVGDSPGRAGRPAFLDELRGEIGEAAEFVDKPGWTVTGERHELICGKESQTVSLFPRELTVAIMDLHPSILRQ